MTRLATFDAGTSLNFSNSSTQKMYESSANAAYGAATALTVCAWTQLTPVITANPLTIVGKGKGTTTNLAWALAWSSSGKVRLDLSTDGSTIVTLQSTNSYDMTNWHHVAFTYNAGTTTSTIYVDGVSAGTSASAPASLFASTMPVTIGGASGAIGTVAFNMSGRIQEVVVTTQVLTLAQIQAIMQRGARNALPTAGTTSSIWVIGEDLQTNVTTLVDYGNAGSTMTIPLAILVDGYGRCRPRLTYSFFATRPFTQNVSTAAGFTDGTNGFNTVAIATDIAEVQPSAQAAIASMTVGVLCYAYTTYDFATNGAPGVTPDIKTDLASLVPQGLSNGAGAKVTIIGYDNEYQLTTPVPEENSPTWFTTAFQAIKTNGFTAMAIPGITYGATPVNASGITGVVDTANNLICTYYIIQAQHNTYTVDTFTNAIFTILNAIYTANPNCRILFQFAFSTLSGGGRVTDQTDIFQAVNNTDAYLRSLGSAIGCYGWGWGGNAPMREVVRTMFRPGQKTAQFVTGTATAGGAATLTNSGATWTTNQWTNYRIFLTGGTGVGQSKTISSNTATVITVVSNWTTNPDATTTYKIERRLATFSGTATSGGATTLTDTSQAWTASQFVSPAWNLFLTGGTGAGQSQAITANTATQLTVGSSWTTNPDATTTYFLGRPNA